jgi:hypothetical protein
MIPECYFACLFLLALLSTSNELGLSSLQGVLESSQEIAVKRLSLKVQDQ